VGSFSEAWAGMPAINLVGSIAPGSSFSSAIGGAPDSQFGADNAISAAGQKLVIGGPGGYGSLSVYSTPVASGGQAKPDLIFGGFYYDTAPSQLTMRPNTANPALANEGFGVGGQYVSEGFVLAGTNDATAYPNRIYNFRRRGPTFLPLRAADTTDVSTLMPALAPKAEAGSAVAIDGKLAVVGAPDYDNRGAVFVYAIDAAGNWTLEAMLQPVGLKNGDRFGGSVSISGERVIVGSPGWDHPLQGYDAGRVVMYERFSAETGSVAWLQKSEFTGPSQYGLFGTDVDLFGTTAIASQPAGPDSQLKVSVYSADAQGEWASTFSFLGNSDSLAVSQDHIVIGGAAPDSVSVYGRGNTGGWVLQATLTDPDDGVQRRFGGAVDISGERIIVGAPGYGSDAIYSEWKGGVYSYTLAESGQWLLETPLSLASTDAGDFYGAAVALDGAALVVGAYGRNDKRGEAYAYSLKRGVWVLETDQATLDGSDAAAGDMVG
ncbi:hypothetical protein EBU58_12930, partial [bacterium]|nr:hypothetical protein [bacterium]